MKNIFRFLMAAAVMFGTVACSQTEINEAVVGQEATATFSIALENLGTRATTAGTAQTIDKVAYGIYDVNASGKYLDTISGVVDYDPALGKVDIEVTLFTGKTYDLVFWAYSSTTNAYTVDMANRSITVNYASNANDEARDAFLHIENGFVAGPNKTFTLKRPFAQLNAGQSAADLDAMAATQNEILKSTVKTEAYSTLSLVDGSASNLVEVEFVLNDIIAGETLTVNGEEFKSIAMNYLLLDNAKILVDTEFSFLGDEGTTFVRKFTNVPLQRNYRTNILGQLISAPSIFTIEIDPIFNEPANNVVIVETAAELAAALTANQKVVSVVLNADIDLPITSLGSQTPGSGEYKLGGEDTEIITIDLNGHKLNVTTTYWSGLGAKNADALFTIVNGTMTSSQASGTWNSYDLCFANCNYAFKDVVFEKAIALTAAGKTFTLENVTINETHDYYALWISAKGQTVNIDGLTINSLGRGIKIDEQYVDAPAKVTLNIENSVIKSTKKGAIIVKSVEGAEINVENLNITEVAADTVFAVWVDEDSAAYADKVVVNGALVKVEGDKHNVVVNSVEELVAAVTAAENGLTTIYLGKDLVGDVTLPQENNKDIVILGNGHKFDGTLVVNGKSDTSTAKSLTIENVHFETANTSHDFISSATDAVRYARNITIKNCTFKGAGNTSDVVAIRLRQAYNLVVEDCEATELHSLAQITSSHDLAFNNVTVNAGRGVNLQTAAHETVVFNNCNFTATKDDGYGIRVDAAAEKATTINNSTLVAFEPIVLRNAKSSFTLNVNNSEYNNKIVVMGETPIIVIDGVINAATSTVLASVLAASVNDATIQLAENENYGTVTVGQLKNVTILGEGATLIINTDANSKLENVTVKEANFVYDGATTNCGIVINAEAQIENLVVEECSFTGTGAKAGRGIYGQNPNATIVLKNCEFKNLGYPVYTMSAGGYKSLVVEGCTFELIKSWAIMPQYNDYLGDLTVTGCTFTNCTGGLVKAGKFTAGHTFTFTDNVVTNSTEHTAKNWFTIDTSAATAVVSGNTKDGVAWTPSAAEGLN